jgi:MFS family permease
MGLLDLDCLPGVNITLMQLTERKVVGTACACHGFVHISELTFSGLILLIMVDFNTDYSTMGRVAWPLFLMFGLTAPLAGKLSDTIGSIRTLSICMLGAAFVCPFIAISQTPLQLSVALGFLGFFVGLYHPAGLTSISRLSRHTGRSLGWHGVAGNIGLSLGPFMAIFLATTVGLGWRGSYLSLCIPALIIGFMALHLSRFEKKAHHDISKKLNLKTEMNLRGIILIFILSAFLGIVYRMVMTYMPAYLSVVFKSFAANLDVHESFIGSLVALPFLLIGACGQLVSGYLSERYRLDHLLMYVVVLSSLSLMLMGAGGVAFAIIGGIGFGVFFFAYQTLINGYVSRLTPRDKRGMMYGINSFVTFGVGSIGSPIGGSIADKYGVGMVLVAAGALGLAMIVFPFLLPGHRMKSEW